MSKQHRFQNIWILHWTETRVCITNGLWKVKLTDYAIARLEKTTEVDVTLELCTLINYWTVFRSCTRHFSDNVWHWAINGLILTCIWTATVCCNEVVHTHMIDPR